MTESKKIIIAGVACAVVVFACLGILAVQSNILAIKSPEPILLAQPETETSPQDSGAVLGETTESNYTNPLSNIYVNPFSK